MPVCFEGQYLNHWQKRVAFKPEPEFHKQPRTTLGAARLRRAERVDGWAAFGGSPHRNSSSPSGRPVPSQMRRGAVSSEQERQPNGLASVRAPTPSASRRPVTKEAKPVASALVSARAGPRDAFTLTPAFVSSLGVSAIGNAGTNRLYAGLQI
jgi:cytoskeletal protein RodZ